MVFQLDIGDKVTHIFAISSKGGKLYGAFRVANPFRQTSLPTDDISLSPLITLFVHCRKHRPWGVIPEGTSPLSSTLHNKLYMQ
jgi:hypothetical protein